MELKDIIEILMRRDGMTENEAWNCVEECRRELHELIDHSTNNVPYYEACDCVMDWLGLEPDYLDVLL